MSLSPVQRAAVERSGQDVCVVAGPGSGKTTVLIERFAWLVEHRGIHPTRILAITFTEKAANEMKQRLVKRFESAPDLRSAVERAWLSTIDAFCARLLHENAIAAGLPPDFAVLEQSLADRMKREAAEEALDQMFGEQPHAMRRLLEALDLSTDDGGKQPDLADALLAGYETMRLSETRDLPPATPPPDILPEAQRCAAALQDSPSLANWARNFLSLPPGPVTLDHFRVLAAFQADLSRGSRRDPHYVAARQLKKEIIPQLEAQWVQSWNADLPDLLRTAILRVAASYGEKKRRQAALDFADLEERAICLLESDPALRQRIAGQFEQVLMDELQDTNRLQWRLVNLLRLERSFFAVGDINQSIYGFRYADRTVFEEYREGLRHAGWEVDELQENYRSRPEVLAAVSHILHGQPGIESRDLTARREFPATSEPVVQRLVGLGDTAAEVEAALVAARIREWADRESREYKDFAILIRALTAAPAFEEALERAGIPYLVSGGRTFLEARETLDLMAFLAALVNPLDEIALAGVLRSPLVGWSDEEILRRGRKAWQAEFERLFGRIRRLAGVIPPDRLLSIALDECGYVARLSERARGNIEKLLAWIRREHRNRPRPLAELLEDVEALRAQQAEAEAPPPEAANAVRILSMHAAKGLEFPVVFVSALHRGPDRSTPVLLFSSDLGLGAKWRNPVTGKSVPDGAHAALAQRRKVEEQAEENRLLYVAMTRAEDRLILSYARKRSSTEWSKLVQAGVAQVTEAESAPETRAGEPAPPEQVVEIARVTPSAQFDSSASVTSVAQFAACPRKYYLGRYLGLEAEAQGAGTGAIELGLEVHRALAGQSTQSAEAADLAQRFSQSALGQRAARAGRCEREFDFLLVLDDMVLRGQIDLWFEESGELVLVDYKTDRNDLAAPEYALQMRLYALALERYAGRRPDRAVLCYLRSGALREVSLGPADLEEARSAVGRLAAAQDKMQFPVNPGEQCRRCSFYGGLCMGNLAPAAAGAGEFTAACEPER